MWIHEKRFIILIQLFSKVISTQPREKSTAVKVPRRSMWWLWLFVVVNGEKLRFENREFFLSGARLPDDRRLYTSPCGIRTKWQSVKAFHFFLCQSHEFFFKKIDRMLFLFWLMIMDSTILVIMDQKLKLHKWINYHRMVSDLKIIMSNRYAHHHEVNSCPENIKFTQARVKGLTLWLIIYESYSMTRTDFMI